MKWTKKEINILINMYNSKDPFYPIKKISNHLPNCHYLSLTKTEELFEK
jgi:hypothetical protein